MTMVAMIANLRPAGQDDFLGEVNLERKDASHWYISGPHSRDYYLLLDEQSDHIFATRLAAHIRDARGICDERAGLATARLLEIWTDDIKKHVWYVFEASRSGEAAESS
jgi:DNA-binding ferritin-like protein